MKNILLILLLWTAVGCGPSMILMVKPGSNERVECRGDGGAFVTRSYAAAHLVAARGAEDCAKQYEKIGFTRVGDDKGAQSAGWTLLLPPVTSDGRDAKRPIAEWEHAAAFDTAKECESFRVFMIDASKEALGEKALANVQTARCLPIR